MAAIDLLGRSRLAPGCLFLVLLASTPACRRGAEAEGKGRAAPIAPAGAAGSGRSIRLATVDPADEPGPSAPPLRVVFAEQGAGVAYVAARAGELRVVHGGRAGRAVAAVDQIAMSPDGRRIAYSAEVDGRWRMVIDDAVGAESTAVGAPVFSPDGRHVAYRATAGEDGRLVVDAKEGPSRKELVGEPAFGAGSDQVAWVERIAAGAPARLVVSDLPLARSAVRLTGVVEMVVNDGRTRIAAVVQDGAKRRVATLGFSPQGPVATDAPYDEVSMPAFGAGGASLAYVAERGGRRFLVLDGKEEALPEGTVAGQPSIRGDGGRAGVMLAAADGQGRYEAFAPEGERSTVRYDEAADLTYAPSGGASAFCARRGASWFVVAGGKEGPPFDRVVTPLFGPDGKHVVYRARKDGKRFVVIADAEGRTIRQLPPYEQVFPVQLAKDGQSIGYGVKDGPELAWKVEPLPSP